MRRREFITLLGGAAAAWSLAARAQQAATPLIGFLSSRSPNESEALVAAFRQGLAEAGYAEGQNVHLAFPLEDAAHSVGQQIHVVNASSEQEIDAAFATLSQQGIGGLVSGTDPFFDTRRDQIIALAAHYPVPTIYSQRAYTVAGGLISYAPSFAEAYRQAGVYTGRVLKGEKPADLPVVQATKFELVINLKTAKALGLTVPQTLQASADEVIE